MLKRIESGLFTLLLLLYIFTNFSTGNGHCESQTLVFIRPSVISVAPGGSFTIEVRVSNVRNLYSWFFNLSWDASILSVVEIEEGPFLSGEGAQKTFFQPKIYNDKGYAAVWCTMLGEPSTSAVSGSGVLARVSMNVKSEGISLLSLVKTELRTYELDPIPHISKNGYFQYPMAQTFIHPSYTEDPSLIQNKTFKVSVNVSLVVDLYSWFFNLSWDASILSVVEIEEGPFLSGEGAQKTSFYSGFDNEKGILYANCTITSSEEGVSGSGTLATILFKVKDIGYTKIELTEVMLYASDGQVIVSSSRGAYFTNIVHDIKISSIDLTDSEVTVGGLAVINVTIENRGNVRETFYVALWANDTLIRYVTIEDLPPYSSKTLTFKWPVSDVNPGSYVISAEAGYLTLEKNTDDNVYFGPILNVQRGLPITAIVYALVIAAVIVIVIVVFVIRRRKQESKL